ncbi:uncharacterized protein LOC129743718 isoform X1 [Uranotaenia lowii]|uniref:uncharacterized protein LOC129743718 isoform X1 n=1 Tax=Uranotaenia lowii TaxID=190385 RepID=UPI002479D343|nr:uncharacterized protein LOC129743718 isoform X1 [Uranotaenia lowii]
MASSLAYEKLWSEKAIHDGAEKKYYEYLAQLSNGKICPKAAQKVSTPAQVVAQVKPPTPTAATVAPTIAPKNKEQSPPAPQTAAPADAAKVKKDRKRNKKNKKDASESPDPVSSAHSHSAIVVASQQPGAKGPEQPPVGFSAPVVVSSNAGGDDSTAKDSAAKKRAKKNKKNKTGGAAVVGQETSAGTEQQQPVRVANIPPSCNTSVNRKLLTSAALHQENNIKNVKEKENLAHKLCDNITEELSKMGSLPAQCTLASEISKARQHIKNSLERMDGIAALAASPGAELLDRLSSVEKENEKLRHVIEGLNSLMLDMNARIKSLESGQKGAPAPASAAKSAPAKPAADDDEDEDDDVDLFGSDEEGEDKAAAELREKRLAEYAAKKSKKPALIAKSNVILDIKPWDDETDMKQMELEVRKITADGLLLGASKLVPLAYGIHKLQLSCVIEDDKISVDWLQEEIEKIEDFVQSVDIAAFNKI